MKNPFAKKQTLLDEAIEGTVKAYIVLDESSEEARYTADTLKVLVDAASVSEKKRSHVPTEIVTALIGSATTIIGYALITHAEETIPIVSKAASLIPKPRI